VKRARFYLGYLSSPDEKKQWNAEEAVRYVSKDAEILTALIRECLFGSQNVVLAALAIVTGHRSRKANDDPFWASAVRSLQDLSDADAFLFLRIVQRQVALSGTIEPRVYLRTWCHTSHVDTQSIRSASWNIERDLIGIGAHDLIASVDGIVGRRMFVADTGGRMGDINSEYKIFFGISTTTLRFYELLHAATLLADRSMFDALELLDPKDVERAYWAQRALLESGAVAQTQGSQASP
jgi:hypothetical protein